jgi:hypothetical protein
VQSQAGNEGSKKDYYEERQASHPGHLLRLWHQDVQDWGIMDNIDKTFIFSFYTFYFSRYNSP